MDMRAVFQGVVCPTTATTTAAAAAAQTVLPFASTSHEYGGSDGGHGHGHGGPTANIIESLLPLFGLRGLAPLYGLVGGSLGVDTTYLLTFFGVAWALNRLLSQLYHLGYGLVSDHLMSSIHVSSSDDIYLHLMKWLAAQPRSKFEQSKNTAPAVFAFLLLLLHFLSICLLLESTGLGDSSMMLEGYSKEGLEAVTRSRNRASEILTSRPHSKQTGEQISHDEIDG